MSTTPTFFETARAFRAWLARHHSEAAELWVEFHKKGSGKPSLTWPESVDEALCYGWIDGVRKSIDMFSYTIRFTPRKPGSTWSRVNINRIEALIKQGKVQPAGLKAYRARKDDKSAIYSYEQGRVGLEQQYERLLKNNESAWSFFQRQPASYQRVVAWWIKSAKKEETRRKRLEKLVEYASNGQRLPQFTSKRPSR